jgi:TatD DNase family protein
MTPRKVLIDAHAHLDGYIEMGAAALDAALAETGLHGIFTISNSMDEASYARNLEIAARSSWVLPVFGIHPWHAHRYTGRTAELSGLMVQSPIYGEIGLDHFFVKDKARYSAQKEIFEFFLGVAREQDKIVIVHTKGAEEEALESLERYALARVVIHWYSGPLGAFRKMIERGFYFTVGGEVMRSEKLRAIAREIPANRLLTETDNPGGPQSYLRRPGTPAILLDIVRSLAAVRKTTPEDLVLTVRSNLENLFGDDARLAGFLDRIIDEEPSGAT